MRRMIMITATLLLTATLTTGCGFFKRGPDASAVEFHFDVTGAGTGKITYSVPQYNGQEDEKIHVVASEEANAALPWTMSGVAYAGTVTLEVTPSGTGPVTCRIRFAENYKSPKKEVAKKQGQPGTPVTCTATVKA
jgi:hypothetical protein